MICTVVVGANLESLVSAHDKSGLAVLLVLEKTNIAGASLLPLTALTIELEEFGAHLEGDLLSFFVSLGVDLLGKLDNGLEVNIGFLLLGLIL